MGKRIEAIKKLQQSTPQEVMAGYLWNFVVNSKDQFWKTKYYDQTAYFELNHDNDAYMIDVLYMGQETSFTLSTFMRKTPDYKSVLGITNQLLQWLENTYAANASVPPEPSTPRRKRRRVSVRPNTPNSVLNMGPGNTPANALNQAPSNGRRQHL